MRNERARLMKKQAGEKGMLLIAVYLLLAVMIFFGVVMAAHALTDIRSSQRSQAAAQAWYLAEGGIDQAIEQLRQNFGWTAGFTNVAIGGSGTYTVAVQALDADRRRLTSWGQSTLLAAPVAKVLEAIVIRQIPQGFYDNVIWAAANLDFNGSAYLADGDVAHGDTTPPSNTSGVTGTVTYNPAANSLPRLSFDQLHAIAQAQGNVYDAARLSGGPGVFPDSFWYTPPTDPNDPTTGVPNINYITTNLVLNGNIGTIGGFFVVVGDVLTNPSAEEDTTINGNGEVAGAIYTTGNFRVNGGGNGLNVDGGVWAGNEVRLNGHATLTYDADHMAAIQALGINADVQVVSWRDLS